MRVLRAGVLAVLPVIVFCLPEPAFSEDFLSNTSLDDLLSLEISVASGAENKLTSRESPGVVTVLTRDDFRYASALNLEDLLAYIPGYQFLSEDTASAQISVRGLPTEGRVLFTLDGMQLNENVFGDDYFLLSTDWIERVEIIRGPGSALYGGYAELGVINIYTRDMVGKTSVSAGSDALGASSGRYLASIQTGFGGDGPEDFSGHLRALYYDFDGSYGLFQPDLDISYLNAEEYYNGRASELHFSAQWQTLLFNLAYTKGRGDQPTNTYDYSARRYQWLNGVESADSDILIAQLSHTYRELSQVNIYSQLRYADANAYESRPEHVALYPGDYFYIPTTELSFETRLNYQPDAISALSLDVGYGYSEDSMEVGDQMVETFDQYWEFESPVGQLRFHKHHVFAQALLDFESYVFTLGVRTEDQSQFGRVTVPRIALTYVQGDFHYKLLAAKAYKAPTLGQLVVQDYNDFPDLEPETTQNIEAEVGYRLNEHRNITLNMFEIELEDTLTYVDGNSSYANAGQYKTQGFELEYKTYGDWGFMVLGLSRYWLADANVPPAADLFRPFSAESAYREVISDKVIGAAERVVSLRANLKITDHVSLAPSFLYHSDRYSVDYIEALQAPNYVELDSQLVFNLHFIFEELWAKGLSGKLGVDSINQSEYIRASSDRNDLIPHHRQRGHRVQAVLTYEF